MHKPWPIWNPLTKLLKDRDKIIRKFKRMIEKKEVHSFVSAQYLCAMKQYAQRKIEMITTKGAQQLINMDNLDDDERDQAIIFCHLSHFSDNKHSNNSIEEMTLVKTETGQKAGSMGSAVSTFAVRNGLTQQGRST